MRKISLTAAWNETAAFVKREARLLFPLAFMLLAVPMAIVTGLMPEPGSDAGAELAWLPAFLVALLIGVVGQVALCFLALTPNRSVGEALRRGATRLLPAALAILLLVVGAVLVLFVAAIVAVLATPGLNPAAPTPQAVARASGIMTVICAPFLIYFGARMLPLMPIAAAEEAGPVEMLKRSWALTRGRVGLMAGFLLLVLVLLLVLNLAVSTVSGSVIVLLTGPMQPGSAPSFVFLLISAILQTVTGVYLNVMAARVYAQLAEPPTKGI